MLGSTELTGIRTGIQCTNTTENVALITLDESLHIAYFSVSDLKNRATETVKTLTRELTRKGNSSLPEALASRGPTNES